MYDMYGAVNILRCCSSSLHFWRYSTLGRFTKRETSEIIGALSSSIFINVMPAVPSHMLHLCAFYFIAAW